MIYELRVYDIMPGKGGELNKRFQDVTSKYFKKYGIKEIGYWTNLAGPGGYLTYMLAYESMEDREQKWAKFSADTERRALFAESEKNGPLIRNVSNQFLQPTAFSPLK